MVWVATITSMLMEKALLFYKVTLVFLKVPSIGEIVHGFEFNIHSIRTIGLMSGMIVGPILKFGLGIAMMAAKHMELRC